MAKARVPCVSVFLLVLILSHLVLSSKGRHLQAEKRGKECQDCVMHGKSSAASATREGGTPSTRALIEGKKVGEYEVSGQPTSPGHSPGIGHMLKNNMH
ncbi:hypothetical protein MRB53_033636 [Persea americana]|uniref:Uncharacterized protein n=1 Tax=Persea americana TaxID=3435 RepID=A0ACC2KV14_PERAE|nr:hypothetical protein MRB53_033636 [Persea americana]